MNTLLRYFLASTTMVMPLCGMNASKVTKAVKTPQLVTMTSAEHLEADGLIEGRHRLGTEAPASTPVATSTLSAVASPALSSTVISPKEQESPTAPTNGLMANRFAQVAENHVRGGIIAPVSSPVVQSSGKSPVVTPSASANDGFRAPVSTPLVVVAPAQGVQVSAVEALARVNPYRRKLLELAEKEHKFSKDKSWAQAYLASSVRGKKAMIRTIEEVFPYLMYQAYQILQKQSALPAPASPDVVVDMSKFANCASARSASSTFDSTIVTQQVPVTADANGIEPSALTLEPATLGQCSGTSLDNSVAPVSRVLSNYSQGTKSSATGVSWLDAVWS